MTTDNDEALRLARELIAAHERAYVMPGSLLLARALIAVAAERDEARRIGIGVCRRAHDLVTASGTGEYAWIGEARSRLEGPQDVRDMAALLADSEERARNSERAAETLKAENDRLRVDLRCAEIQAVDRGNSFAELKAENERLLGLALATDDQVSGETEKCSGHTCKGSNPAEPPHPCPYKEDVDGNSTDLCNCCETCRLECGMNI